MYEHPMNYPILHQLSINYPVGSIPTALSKLSISHGAPKHSDTPSWDWTHPSARVLAEKPWGEPRTSTGWELKPL